MRLLFIVPYTPTPIRTRPYFFLKQLAARGHTLTLATLWQTPAERDALSEWGRLGVKIIAAQLPRFRSLQNVLRALPSTHPLQAEYCRQPALAKQLTELLAHAAFDACHVEHLRGALYGTHIQTWARENSMPLRIVWDSVDCISALFEQAADASKSIQSRLMTRLELGRTRKFEPAMVQAFDATTVVTEPERDAMIALANPDTRQEFAPRVHVVPNGVDGVYFDAPERPRDPKTILFSGKMSYHANLTAAFFLLDEIMPRVWRTMPETRVVIAGQNPPQSLMRRGTESGGKIEVTGSVPDLRPFMARATVACAPMVYGAGVQNKILEAMAMRLPVVASQQAARALKVQNGRELLIGVDADELSAQLLDTLGNETLRTRLAQTARAFIETQCRWQDSVEKLERLYQQPTN